MLYAETSILDVRKYPVARDIDKIYLSYSSKKKLSSFYHEVEMNGGKSWIKYFIVW